ncbi:MAG: hypothetical protein ACK55Z_05190 [bacterium]
MRLEGLASRRLPGRVRGDGQYGLQVQNFASARQVRRPRLLEGLQPRLAGRCSCCRPTRLRATAISPPPSR